MNQSPLIVNNTALKALFKSDCVSVDFHCDPLLVDSHILPAEASYLCVSACISRTKR